MLVTVEYRIKPEDKAGFLEALHELAGERRRDGAFDWAIFGTLLKKVVSFETLMLDSCVEHLHQHQDHTGRPATCSNA